MRKLIVLCIVSTLTGHCFALSPELEAVIKEAKEDAQSKKMDSFHNAQHFSPPTVFDQYTNHPDQTKYYKGVMQKDTQQMDVDKENSRTSESAKMILDSVRQHPHYVISQSDQDIQQSQFLQQEAYNITHGVTDQYIDCKPKEVCTTQYQEHQCNEAPQTLLPSCKKKLIIDIISHETITHYFLTAHLTVRDHYYAGVSMNTVNGRIDFLGPHDASFRLDGRLPSNIDCHTLFGTITSQTGNARLDNISFPSCANGLGLDIHFSGGHRLDLQIDMASKVVTYEVKDHWLDDCTSIANDTTCKLKSHQCDIPGSTRVIQGIPVTRDCWQEKFDYICHGGSGEGNCKPLQSQGCEQVDSECIEKTKDQCSLYRQTYRCPTQMCAPTTNVVCGNGQEYCLDGNCTDHSYQESKDFAKGVSALSGAIDAAKQFDQSSKTIFTGHPIECSEKPIGFSNCCTETGWGHDIGLDHCPDAAKKLHVDRENKLAIKVGRYCSNEVLGVCVEHAQVFCVFNSKLAKIIEEQGRKKQLHLGFGKAETPNCSGITPEQLQKIDFSLIDFEDFINDLSKNVKHPDLKQIQDLIEQHVQQNKQAGQDNG